MPSSALTSGVKAEEIRLIGLSEALRRLGFILEDREPEYETFLRVLITHIKRKRRGTYSPEEIANKNEVALRNVDRNHGTEGKVLVIFVFQNQAKIPQAWLDEVAALQADLEQIGTSDERKAFIDAHSDVWGKIKDKLLEMSHGKGCT